MAKPLSNSNRINGHYIKLPTTPFKSQAYKDITPNAKLLFGLMALAYTGYNNGSIVATWQGFKSLYGFSASKQTFYRLIKELIEMDLVLRTYKGHKGRVSRYGLALWGLDKTDDVLESKDYQPGKAPIERYLRHELKGK